MMSDNILNLQNICFDLVNDIPSSFSDCVSVDSSILPNIILSHLPAPSTTMVDVECSSKLRRLNGDGKIRCLYIDTYLWGVKPVCGFPGMFTARSVSQVIVQL